MADALLIKTLIVIVASVSAISLIARAGLPAAGGYLLAGLVIGPHGLQLIATSDETRFLAELGIIFLMFMVGLEFSLPAMIAARRDVFGAGGLQLGFTVLIVAGVVMLWGCACRNQIRRYWWCSPPRIGRQRMCPASSTAREIGASFFNDKCVRISL
jgi:Kef-type K+ transport system membrane component KefB